MSRSLKRKWHVMQRAKERFNYDLSEEEYQRIRLLLLELKKLGKVYVETYKGFVYEIPLGNYTAYAVTGRGRKVKFSTIFTKEIADSYKHG